MRNKVASVAVGRCAVAELRCAFAALFAQDAALPSCHAATPPSGLRTVSAYAAHRLRIGHAATATATMLGLCATPLGSLGQDATHRHAVAHPSMQRRHHPPLFAGAVATPPCPHGPGHLPRAQRGLPLALNKLGFGTALLHCLYATILTR